MLFAIDFAGSLTYFPQVIHISCSTYQQVCDVKLALIGSENYDCSGHSSSNADRVNPHYRLIDSQNLVSTTINGNSYLSAL